jgi:uncharacterized membrane protein YjdF
MLAATSVFTVHTPSDPLEWLTLVGAIAVSIVAGVRVGGRGYAICSVAMGALAFVIIGNVAIPFAIALVNVAFVVRVRITGEPGRRDGSAFARECVIILGGLGAYTLGRFLAESDPGTAFSNTDRVMAFERSLGLFFEPRLQEIVQRSEPVLRTMNWIYSFAFLAITGAILIWLWLHDDENYRLMRNSMALSALIAIPLMAVFPVAPPRLVPDSGMVDTIAIFGREHAFANEYAAIPSLHVGWMAVAGLALGRSIGGRLGVALALALGPLMAVNVMVTGNHFWVDGVIGAAIALGAAGALLAVNDGKVARMRLRAGSATQAVGGALVLIWATLGENRRALFSFLSLGGLLAYLLIAQRLTPGFTDFWGYLVGQVAVFLILLVAAEVVFAKEGGLSWITHVIAVACAYADVLGTDGNLYARIDEYDKLTHFAGVAAITAGMYDVLRCLYQRGSVKWAPNDRLMLSIALGIAIGIGWEVYELIGDKVFNTARVGGRWDTANDIVSDSLGAVALALVLWWGETRTIASGEQVSQLADGRASVKR